MKTVDEVIPRFVSHTNTAISPELKFYGNRVKMDERLNANMEGLYCLGHSDAGRIGL